VVLTGLSNMGVLLMPDYTKRNEQIVKRLDEIISQCRLHKQNKTLQNNYHVVLKEMENLRDGNQSGD